MAIKPTVSTLDANSVGIINAIRNNASAEYYQAVPEAKATTESIRMVGEAICAQRPRMNEFINALVNRIALVTVTSKSYSNPLSFVKKGVLEFGETIEEIFVDIAKAHPFDQKDSENTLFKREVPNVSSMFHAVNYEEFYPVTISDRELRRAFLSLAGVTDLISKIVRSVYSASEVDEYIMTKYTIAQLLLNGSLKTRTIVEPTDDTTARASIVAMKSIANKFNFMSTDYNIAGVYNFCPTENTYVITTAEFDALTDVEVLAKAFNMSKTEWLGRHAMVDSFSFNASEVERLDMLLAKDEYYQLHKLSSGDLEALDKVTAFSADAEFFQFYDNLLEFTEVYNGKGLYWNYFYHVWKIFSASPFANAVAFTTITPTVTSVTVNGSATATAESTVVYTASVSATDFANKGVVWSIASSSSGGGDIAHATIDNLGRARFDASASGNYDITATSAFDSSVKGTKTVTVS